MKKIIPILLIALLILSGCESGAVKDVNVKFEKTSNQIDDADLFYTEAEKVLKDIGVEDYKFVRFGNYSKTTSDLFSVDALYTTSKDPLIVGAFHGSRTAWEIKDIQNAKDEKYYYNTGVFADEEPLYSYTTGELLKAGMTEQQKLAKAQKMVDKMNNDPDVIQGSIESHINENYTDTNIDSVTINDDMGTGSGFIATINLTWNVKNSAGTAKEVLKTYSDDLAATIADKYTSVNEIAIFWNVPYLTDKTSKWSYTCRDGGAYLSDNVINF